MMGEGGGREGGSAPAPAPAPAPARLAGPKHTTRLMEHEATKSLRVSDMTRNCKIMKFD